MVSVVWQLCKWLIAHVLQRHDQNTKWANPLGECCSILWNNWWPEVKIVFVYLSQIVPHAHYQWNSGTEENVLLPRSSQCHPWWMISVSSQAWGAARKVSKDDWLEWLRRLSVVLLKESSSPALRSCWSLAQTYIPLARLTTSVMSTSLTHFLPPTILFFVSHFVNALQLWSTTTAKTVNSSSYERRI